MKDLWIPFEKTNKTWLINSVYVFGILLTWILYSNREIHTFPSIYQVKDAFIYLYNKGLIRELFTSILLCLKSLGIGLLISCIFVYLSPINILKPLSQICSLFRFLPLVGFSYYIGLEFNGSTTQTITLSLYLLFFTVTSLLSIIQDIKPEEFDHVYSLNFTKYEVIKELIILSRLDYLVDLIRINFAITLFMLVQVESSLRSNGGIGSLIHDAEHLGKHENLIALQIIILFTGLGFDRVFTFIRKNFFRYTYV